jgi:hypothetical protein
MISHKKIGAKAVAVEHEVVRNIGLRAAALTQALS